MATVRDYIQRALRKNGVLGFAESLDGNDAAVALEVLVAMVDSWSLEPGVMTGTYTDGFTTTPTVASYSSTLLAQGRPANVVSGKTVLAGTSYPLNLLFTAAEYDQIPRTDTPGIAYWCWYNETVPNSTFTFWPVPYAAFTVELQCTGILLGSALDLNTTLVVAPGYSKAIVDALAVECCSDFGRTASALLVEGANEAKAWVKRHNRKPRDVRSLGLPAGAGSRRRYDIYGDY